MSAEASSAPPRAKWKYEGKAKEFHAAHEHERYTMAFSGFLDRAMVDPELPAVARAMFGSMRLAWGHLSDEAVDGYPKLDPDDPDPRRLTQEAFADRVGMKRSTLSEAATFLRKRNYWKPEVGSIYPDDQRNPTLFASQRAPRSDSTLRSSSPDVKTDIPTIFALSSPFVIGLKNRWMKEHKNLVDEEEEIRRERAREKARWKENDRKLSGRQREIEHQRMNWCKKEWRAALNTDGLNSECERPEAEIDATDSTVPAAEFAAAEPSTQAPAPADVVRDIPREGFATSADSVRDIRSEIPDARMETGVNSFAANEAEQVPLKLQALRENPPSSSSLEPLRKSAADEETTTIPAQERETAEAGELLPVMLEYGQADVTLCRILLRACRRYAPDAKLAEVIAVIRQKGPTARSRTSPSGFLLRAVPIVFEGEGVRLLRERLKGEGERRNKATEKAEAEHLMAAYDEWCVREAEEFFLKLPDETRELLRRVKRRDLCEHERWKRIPHDVQDREIDEAVKQDIRRKLVSFDEWRRRDR